MPVRSSKERLTARAPVRLPGRIRFKKLLAVTEELLAERSIEKVGLYQIAERAGLPAASVYHFFPNKEAVIFALAAEYHVALQEIARASLLPPPLTWKDLVVRKVTLAADYHNEHPAALRLFMGANVNIEVKEADVDQTLRLARCRLELFQQYFHMPHVDDWERRLAISISIVDGVFGLSYQQHKRIEPHYVEDAHRASIAYLSCFLPDRLMQKIG